MKLHPPAQEPVPALRDICHDIRNSIGIIRVASDILKSGGAPPEKREYYFSLVEQNLENVESSLKHLELLQSGTLPLGEK